MEDGTKLKIFNSITVGLVVLALAFLSFKYIILYIVTLFVFLAILVFLWIYRTVFPEWGASAYPKLMYNEVYDDRTGEKVRSIKPWFIIPISACFIILMLSALVLMYFDLWN